jgi:activator of HSP90 ATPase
MESIELSCELAAPPERVFEAWLSAEGHTAMTGSPARIDGPEPGGFTTWDGYIVGRTLEATPFSRILQAWRTSDFGAEDPDSLLEVLLEPVGGGTKLTLRHSKLPVGSSQEYTNGWLDFYFTPMKAYFSR